ncbi:gas vesicle protein [Natronomonas sp. LN261]|uniref:gas vesicle protein GvpO n=1 Tax=Natronomonas sp. LN261 TaxID=2750669 RepID=UPI0015EEB387|nr:gas vesicle protein [Natronomonas sp. LN261]
MPDHANDHDDGDDRADSMETGAEEADGAADQSGPAEDGSGQSTISLGDAQRRAREVAAELLEYEFEGVIKVETTDGGWRTVIEVIERSAVPDTQDIIGRYEIGLDATGSVTGYELLERYRRGDMKEEL